MRWTIAFLDSRVEAGVLKMPAGFVARLIRYAERMEAHGPDPGMPHTRAMGAGLFELRLEELDVARTRMKELKNGF